jgi:2'-5' RNA ligase
VLFVVAWPLLGEADEQALRRLRAQYHPTEAATIGPHFTLVFGAPVDQEAALQRNLRSVRQKPFWFVLDRVVRFDQTPPSQSSYLFATPADGTAELTGLYEVLNPQADPGVFDPHITLGLFSRAGDAEHVARLVERQHLPMHGRIETISLLRRAGNTLETLESVRLSS